MLRLSPGPSIYSTIVSGIFLICSGQYISGMESISLLWDIVDSLEEAVAVADVVVMQIASMGTARSGMYFSSHVYPLDEVPHCTYINCVVDDVCEDCFAFWYSHIVRAIC